MRAIQLATAYNCNFLRVLALAMEPNPIWKPFDVVITLNLWIGIQAAGLVRVQLQLYYMLSNKRTLKKRWAEQVVQVVIPIFQLLIYREFTHPRLHRVVSWSPIDLEVILDHFRLFPSVTETTPKRPPMFCSVGKEGHIRKFKDEGLNVDISRSKSWYPY